MTTTRKRATTRKTPAKKTRARTEDGQFIADDPATPEVNEAWVEVEPAKPVPSKVRAESKAPAEKPSGIVYYVSAKPESQPFVLQIADKRVRGSWDMNREYVTWKVPADIAHLADLHHHVFTGRIIRCKD